MVYLPEVIKEIRLSFGFSQAKVAKGINIKPQTYHRYESGERKPNIELIYSLAKFYNISAIHFLLTAPTKKFIPDFELKDLPRWAQTRDNLVEYSLYDVAYQFEDTYLKTMEAYRKFRNLQKRKSKTLKQNGISKIETSELNSHRQEYRELRTRLKYYEDMIKLLLEEKLKALLSF